MGLQAFLCRINWFEDNYLWQRKLGQYSLVESVSRRESMLCKLVKLPFTCTQGAHLLRMFGLHYIQQVFQGTVGSTTGEPVELSVEVKKALVHSLKRTDGKLTNGESSLKSNGAYQLLWSRIEENQTHVILTWNIATCYCVMARAQNPCSNEGTELKSHLEVATILSRYCAYLVVSAPRLLPGDHNETKHLLDVVTREATEFLQDQSNKYEKMESYVRKEDEAMRNLAESEETFFQSGVKLGKQLEEIEDVTQRWKVMADFWAEMMLYVAPSDNVKEHIEQLAQGGEFITHLWALLSHAGILEREDHQVGGV